MSKKGPAKSTSQPKKKRPLNRSSDTPKIYRRALFGFFAANLMLVLLSWFLQTQLTYVEETSNKRAQLRTIAFEFRSLKALITEAEVEQRGFLLTGNKKYLQPYKEATLLIEDKLSELKIRLQ